MSGWDTTSAGWDDTGDKSANWNAGGDNDWNQTGSQAGAVTGDRLDDTEAAANGFDAGHNGDDDGAGASADDSCRNCGGVGHFARDCPEPRKDVQCYNCGGAHLKKDCDKPLAPRKLCKLCKTEGDHETIDCKEKYPLDFNGIADLAEAECWDLIQKASDSDDIYDFHEGMKTLQKAASHLSYVDIERKLRETNSRFFLVALKKDVGGGMTNVDFQGHMGKTYTVSVQKNAGCVRPKMLEMWPKDPEENLSRLADAGITLQSGLTYCRNCEKYGSHIQKHCPEPKIEADRVKIICALCGEEGHRVRDCTQERKKPREPRTCKICGSEDHIAKECDSKPAFTCRNCGQEGHKASECTEPRKILCNNCEKEGHIARDCDQPRDWSKVTCRHCGEKGHASAGRCKPGAARLDTGTDENATPTDNTGAYHEADGSTTAAATNGQAKWDDAGGQQECQSKSGVANDWENPPTDAVAATAW